MKPISIVWFLAIAACGRGGSEAKQEAKADAKPDAKVEAKAEAKPDAAPAATPEATPDAGANAKPARAPIAITGIPECDEFIGLSVAIIDCLPSRRASMLPMLQQTVETTRSALADGDPETREAFRSQCAKNIENVRAPGGGDCPVVIPERNYAAELESNAEQRVGVASLEHCTSYIDAIDKLLGCDRISAETRADLADRKTETRDALAQHENTPDAERIRLDGLCWETLETLRTSMPSLGCSL